MDAFTHTKYWSTGLVVALSFFSAGATQPSPATNSVSLGASLTNKVTATSSNPPLTFQWRLDDMPLSGATRNILTLTNIQSANAGHYTVVASDATGEVVSRPWTVQVDPT